MDYRIARALDHFAARHDGFEDPVRAYSVASEYLFLTLVAALVVVALVRREALCARPACGPSPERRRGRAAGSSSRSHPTTDAVAAGF